ncbi:MAG: sensor histidine kinase [Marinifilaceae bacterium]
MEKKRALIVMLFGVILFTLTIIWENYTDKIVETHWVEQLSERLHKVERDAKSQLSDIAVGTAPFVVNQQNDDVIYLVFKSGQLVNWSNKKVGNTGIYTQIMSPRPIIKINGTYYEKITVKGNAYDYCALIKLRDDELYTNDIIRNKFASFFKIDDKNANQIELSPSPMTGGAQIYSHEGIPLFQIRNNGVVEGKSISIIALSIYILFFVCIFYCYSRVIKYAPSARKQFLYFVVFVILLVSVRAIICHYRLPLSLYRLSVFQSIVSGKFMLTSIGDLFVTTFCICQTIYLSLKYLKLDYTNTKLVKYRGVVVGLFVLFAYLYATLFNFVIASVVANSDVCLNIALIANIDITSIIAFIATLLGGMGLILIMDSGILLLTNFLSWRYVMSAITITLFVLQCIGFFVNPLLSVWETIFLWGMFMLLIINRYLVKKELQRTLYVVIMFFLSVYVVTITKQQEQYKELTMRAAYATQLIEEKDLNFEKQLLAFDKQLKNDGQLNNFLINYDEELFKKYLQENVFNVVGFNYDVNITTCYPHQQLLLPSSHQVYDCNTFFESQIQRFGKRVGNSSFYLIDQFDGKITYLGVFLFQNVHCYIDFTSEMQVEKNGYEAVLSRNTKSGNDAFYEYSFGKYHNNKLIASGGNFKYYKDISRFGKRSEDISIINKDYYSHIIIPLQSNNAIVISMHESVFKVYYMNVLYAFFFTILLSSYGLLLGTRLRPRNRSFKQRIKNRVIALIFVLFIMLTSMSIYLNKRTFQARQDYKSTEFLNYVQQQLTPLDCVDARMCPQILDILNQLSDLLQVDINIYSTAGELIATSEENIFKYGFDGNLINPEVLQHLVTKGEMSYVAGEQIGDAEFRSVYMPFELDNGRTYIINIPYFAQNAELNREIIIMVVIAVNLAIIVMMIAFILSGFVADRITRPLEMLNSKLRKMHVGGQNEKIYYKQKDEVGLLVKEYNNMVDKLDESILRLAKSERESAWREMARQIAHEVKNPLTPMKLNIQLLQRSCQMEQPERFKERFNTLSNVLIEQIDNMASMASTFSDFARIHQPNNEWFNMSELVHNCVALFETNVSVIESVIDPNIMFYADKKQMQRVLVNLLKNAEQSVPDEKDSIIRVELTHTHNIIRISIADNGIGIPHDLQEKIFEPNFTTKSGGTGLGLAISNSIIKGFGGEIAFESIIDKGTTFVITLPVVVDESVEYRSSVSIVDRVDR